MTEFKVSADITAVPLLCDKCGRCAPLYQLLIEYDTAEDSEDYRDGIKRIETGFDDGYYCKRCIDQKLYIG